VVEAIAFGETNLGAEEVTQALLIEELGPGAVTHDAAILHHQDTVDLRDDVGDVVGDKQNTGSLLGKPSKQVTQFILRSKIESI
jgi:hypothetical protein